MAAGLADQLLRDQIDAGRPTTASSPNRKRFRRNGISVWASPFRWHPHPLVAGVRELLVWPLAPV
jgi:hypothetical protein